MRCMWTCTIEMAACWGPPFAADQDLCPPFSRGRRTRRSLRERPESHRSRGSKGRPMPASAFRSVFRFDLEKPIVAAVERFCHGRVLKPAIVLRLISRSRSRRNSALPEVKVAFCCASGRTASVAPYIRRLAALRKPDAHSRTIHGHRRCRLGCVNAVYPGQLMRSDGKAEQERPRIAVGGQAT